MNHKYYRLFTAVLLAAILAFPGLPARAAEEGESTVFMPIAAGYDHSAVIKEDGSLWMSGANTFGQLGNGKSDAQAVAEAEADEESQDSVPVGATGLDGETSVADSTEFVQVMEHMKAVYAGYLVTYAIGENGTLYVWGWNQGGQLGLGTTDEQTTPVSILNDVVMADPGDYHSAAVTEDGTLWTWGWNEFGQLGFSGGDDTRTIIAPKEALDNVRTAAVGMQHTLAVKNDDTLWAAGSNDYGQLGNGTTESTEEFVQVMDHVKSVAATAFGSLILKTDNTLWVCGYNYNGELGTGNYDNVPEPVQIMENVGAVTASRDFAAAIDRDGALYVWGSNSYGQYSGSASSEPVLVTENVAYVSTGGGHMLYLTKDGTFFGCGNNGRGQLGNNTTDSTATPIVLMEGVPSEKKSALAMNAGPIAAAIALGAAVVALFTFLIVQTLRGGKKKKPVKKAVSPENKGDTDKVSDRELIRAARTMEKNLSQEDLKAAKAEEKAQRAEQKKKKEAQPSQDPQDPPKD